MAIWQGDVFFQNLLELIIEDVRKNPWLIDDALSDFVTDPMLSSKYGQAEIENAKKWFLENEISVLLPHRNDVEKIPCLTIDIGSNFEDKALATMGDLTSYVDEYSANEVGQTIPYVIEPFDYVSYDQATGFFETPDSVDLTVVQPGMVVVDPATGGGWAIRDKNAEGFFIAEGTVVSATSVGILPQYRIFRARRERATFQEKISIGCHTHGDPNSTLWLYSIVLYGLLRYREGAFESRNFQLSNLDTSDLVPNPNFANFGENVFSRFITVSGQVENTWAKRPKRIIEGANLRNPDGEIKAGLIIINEEGGEVPDIIDTECETWVAED